MNIYEKMQKAKVMLQKKELKKTGVNKFSGYKYYELGDFMPAINEICEELKLFTQVDFASDFAVLTVINTEKTDENLEYNSEMIKVALKGCNEIQALGGVQTYQRRYLYMNAFEISENDYYIDGNDKEQNHDSGNKEQNNNNDNEEDCLNQDNQENLDALINEKQAKVVHEIMLQKGIDIEKNLKKNYDITSTKDLTKSQYASILNAIKDMPNKK